MGDQKKEEEEKKVPVFTVFKKNSILKNIFLDAPQTNEPLNSTTNQEDDEQVIVLGRHPDCSITLDHPSISRFHLRLHSKPSSLTLSLVDLSSVHGTWVSGKKVEPGVQVALNEGDIVQLGASSRRYMLHWVPMSRAYNSDVPFVPPMDVLMTVKESEELSNQDENCCSSIETYQIQPQCTSLGNLDLSISIKETTVSPLALTMPEFGYSSRNNEEAKKGNLSREKGKQNEISGISSEQPLKELIKEIKNHHSVKDSENSPNASSFCNDHNKDLFREEHEENKKSGFSSRTPLKEEALIEEIKNQHSDKDWESSLTASSPSNDRNKDLFREEREEYEIPRFSPGAPLQEELIEEVKNQHSDKDSENSPDVSSPGNDHSKAFFREEGEEYEISGLSSVFLLKEELIEEIEYQHSDKDSENSPYAIIPGNDHSKAFFREEGEEYEIPGLSSVFLLKEELIEEIEYQHFDKDSENSPYAIIPGSDHSKGFFREESQENEMSGFSSGTHSTESAVTKFENQQSDKENDETPQALAGLLTGISHAKIPSVDHNKNLLREEFEENELCAFSSGQVLSESVVEIEYQQYDEEYENSQDLNGVLSGIVDVNRTPTVDHYEHPLRGEFEVLSGIANANSSTAVNHNREEFEEHVISASSSGQLLYDSVLEVECQENDEVCENSQAVDGVLSGRADANSNSTIYQNEHLWKEEFGNDEISALASVQILNESVVEIGNQQYNENVKDEMSQALDGVLSGITDSNSSFTLYQNEHPLKKEFEEDEISAFTSVQILDESVVEIGSQRYDEDNVKSQAIDGVPSSVANSPSLCQNYHNKNLSEFFDSSLSNEDMDIICAPSMDDEQKKMSTSGCYSNCSSTILDRNDQLYLYEHDNNVQYSTSSGVHAIQPMRNTPSKSDQESHWPEITGESSEALDKESSLKADNKQKEITVITRAPKMDLMNLSICCESIPTEDCFGQLDGKNKAGQTFAINVSEPKDTDVSTPLRSGKQFDIPTVGGKPTSIDIQTGQWFPTNSEVKELYKENVDGESVSEALISNVEVFSEEIFTPDKENFTPNTHKQRSTKKTNKLEEIKLSDPLYLLSSPTKNSMCWNFVQDDESVFSSDKENCTPKVLRKSRLVQPASKTSGRLNLEPATKNGISRIPFKSLLSDSTSKSCSSNSSKYAQPIEKTAVAGDNKRWIMVADTNSLLNKVSRKALQLLQGVKGTQLIIPRVVMRELDCMKRRGYLFTRTEILSALQWIKDCMINTNWWIHVENLMEGEKHLTPASSLSASEGEIEDFAFSSTPFSAYSKILEIVSPTPGDHILECALLNRRMKNDENLVILSDDVSLKIKAMAEGIICEAAEEFRESLVNPFSDRFLWPKSSPRGLTWSCADDIVLRDKYYRGPFKKPPSKSRESLKGLKLILVQNSHFSGLIPNSIDMSCF